jgi:sortase A
MTLSRLLGGIGRVLISAGVLILLFVAYQLWGTGLQTRAAQNQLDNEFESALAEWQEQQDAVPVASTTPSTTTPEDDPGTSDTTTPPTTAAPYLPAPPPAENGEAVAVIRNERIGLDWNVVEGVGVDDLRKGPGHYPGTPMPGQPGNAAIAGHRTTYGAPFFKLNELQTGDIIFVTTLQGAFEYRVTEQFIVDPSEYNRVIREPEGDLLTLTTCHPRYTARERLIIQAELLGPTAPAPPPPTPEELAAIEAAQAEELATEDVAATSDVMDPSGDSSAPDTAVGAGDTDTDETDTDETDTEPAGAQEQAAADEAFANETLDENIDAWKSLGNWGGVLPWMALCAAVWLGAWLLAKEWKKVPAYLMGLPIFMLFLFMTFENLAELLPAAY